jgi:hypothetical protein
MLARNGATMTEISREERALARMRQRVAEYPEGSPVTLSFDVDDLRDALKAVELNKSDVAEATRIEQLRKALELMPDEIEIFRIMRAAHGNSHSVMAKAVAARIESIRDAALIQSGER